MRKEGLVMMMAAGLWGRDGARDKGQKKKTRPGGGLVFRGRGVRIMLD
jgi:hypothetical protein